MISIKMFRLCLFMPKCVKSLGYSGMCLYSFYFCPVNKSLMRHIN